MLSKDTHLPGTRAVPTYRWALMLVTSLFSSGACPTVCSTY